MSDVLHKPPVTAARPRLRGRHLVVAAVMFGLIGLVAWVFRPTVQREFLLDKLTPLVDSLALDHVRITPWSMRVEGLDLAVGGGRYRAAEIDLGFNPLGLFAHTVSLGHVIVTDAELDLRNLAPGAPADDTPFPGALAALNHGYALRLGALRASLHLLLPGQQTLDVELDGGGFAPVRAGTLTADLAYLARPGTPPLKARVQLGLTQLNRGRVRALVADVDTALTLPAPAGEQHLGVTLAITPPPEHEDPDQPPPTRNAPDGTVRILPVPEDIKLVARLGNSAPAALEVQGSYHGEDGRFRGHYLLSDISGQLQNLAGTTLLPSLDTDTRGSLEVDSLSGAGTLSVESRTRVGALARVLGDNPELPEYLDFMLAGHASFDAKQAQVTDLELRVADAAGAPRVLAVSGAPIAIDLAAPLALLDTPRELLRIAVGPLPLQWFEGLTHGPTLEGELLGPFVLGVDEQKRVKLDALAAATISRLRVTDPEAEPIATPANTSTVATTATVVATATSLSGAVLVENLDLSVRPTASWSPDFLRYALNDLTIRVDDKPLLSMDLKAASKPGDDAVRTWRYRLDGTIEYDALGDVPVVARRLSAWPLPKGLKLAVRGLLSQRAATLSLEKADVDVSSADNPRLVTVDGLRPFNFTLGGEPHLDNPVGDLASIAARGIDLAWANPFLADLQVAGHLAKADFKLAAPSSDTLAVAATAPLVLDGFGVTQGTKALARGLAIRVSPDARYAPGDTEASLTGLSVRTRAGRLVGGDLAVTVKTATDKPPVISARGKLAVDVARLAAQPVLAAALGDALPATVPLAARLDFDVATAGERITVNRTHAELDVDKRARFVLEAKPGLEIRTRLAAGENRARHVIGQAALDIHDLSSETLNRFVPLGPVSFAEINSSLRLRSDGNILRAATLAPLGVDAVRINDGKGGEVLHEFSLKTDASLRIAGHEIEGSFDELALAFSAQPERPAITGKVKLRIDPDNQVPLTLLDSKLSADLPQLLSQPAVLPGHKLSAGRLALEVAVDAERRIKARALLDQLASSEPLAIQTFELPVTGEMAADGQGFSFTAPLVGRGRSGVSNATVEGRYAPQPDEPRVLHVGMASELFYLNDILATAQQVTRGTVTPPPSAANAARDTPATPVKIAVDDTPDKKAAWKLLPYAVVMDLQIDKLFYTDYLAFTDVGGQIDLRTRQFALKGIKAHFHDAALKLDGLTRFDAKAAQPYDLDLTANISDFDWNQFLTELVPGEKPRVEGLFRVDVKTFGHFPNFGQLRNRLLFDIRMQSRDGLFRPLPRSSGLLLGASDVLGFIGEGLSYIPTGGFGAGAIARLVNYIVRIDYDSIDIHLQRDETRNVTIEQFQLLSPTIALTASGGIQHQDGTDILDSPLELTAHLDMLGRGAAILYSMDLMQDERDELGYWRGPEFRIWGTLADTHSNFENIINRAADGTTKGAFTRPIAGLIGNLKYRWFDSDSRRRESLQATRREERLDELEAEQAEENTAP